MNILYIAFSCQPNKGSEEKIGWNIPVEACKHHNVFVVTREEQRAKIEEYSKKYNFNDIKFYYIDINPIYKKIYKGSLLSLKLNEMHKKALPLVKKICKEENIDIIHQITPIEFRSIGDYGSIENTKFVCGPLGGGEFLPDSFKEYAKGNMTVEYARKLLNKLSRFKYKLSGKLKKCDYIMFANRETQQYLSPLVSDVESSLYFDNGISESDINNNKKIRKNEKFTMLVAGRLAYRKGHSFLFDVLKEMPKDFDYELRIIGEGPMEKELKKKAKDYSISDKVVFTGRIPFDDMKKEYENADVFVMPSIRETTGAVLLEAMSEGVPIVAIDKFGAPVLFDNSTSFLYSGNTLSQYKNNLRDILLYCAKNPDELLEKGEKLKALSYDNVWSKKLEFYNSIYEKITG